MNESLFCSQKTNDSLKKLMSKCPTRLLAPKTCKMVFDLQRNNKEDINYPQVQAPKRFVNIFVVAPFKIAVSIPFSEALRQVNKGNFGIWVS